MDLGKDFWQTAYQRLSPPTLFVTPREREYTQTRLRSLGKCDLAGTDPNGTGLSPHRQGWLSKPSGKGCGTIHDESGSIPPSTPDT